MDGLEAQYGGYFIKNIRKLNQKKYREEKKETHSPDIVSKGNLPDLGSEGKLGVMILGIVVSLFGMYFYLRRREND